MVCSACFRVGVMPDSDWSSMKTRAFFFRSVASWAWRASCTDSFEVALALAAPPMIEFRSWLIWSQAAVPVPGPVVACADPAALAAALGVLGALVGAPPLLLHPAPATAATAIAPMASLFLIVCSPLRDGKYLGCRP